MLRDRGGQSEKSFQLPNSPPTGATELVFYDLMERGGDRKTLSILWTSGFLHPDDWGNQLSPESAAAPVSNSEAQQVGEGVSRKPWGERVPTVPPRGPPALDHHISSPRGSSSLLEKAVREPRSRDPAWG